MEPRLELRRWTWKALLLNEQILVRVLRALNYIEPEGSDDAAELRHACELPFRLLREAFRSDPALEAAWRTVAPASAEARLTAAKRILDEACARACLRACVRSLVCNMYSATD